MGFLKKLTLSLTVMIVFIGFGSGAPAADLGAKDETIKLAINEWTGQHITTHVAGEILKRMGYKVEFVTAGYYPQMQALPDGTLAATLEIWDNNIGEHYDKAMATGNVLNLGDLGLDANEGWAYPIHVEKLCPGLPDWKVLEKCVEVFATPETIPKGRILAYPADWGHRSADIIKGLNIPYTAVPAGSEGAIVSELKSARARKSPLITMMWSPHWIFAEVDVNWVKLPPGEKACYEDPAWGPNPNAVNDCGVAKPNIFKMAWIGMKKKWPAAHRFLDLFQMADADQIPMMAAIDSRNEQLAEVTKAWVDANQSKWQPWVDAALKGN